jgi:hypothetical protein
MKVQNVEKQCTAKVGIAIEFSNSEVDSIIRLALKLNDAIEEECEKANRFVRSSELGTVYKETDEIPVKIDLKMATRIYWLLDHITMCRTNEPSDLFNPADEDYASRIAIINNREEE